jgi:NAD(P)-dependent dehydrogenase (short-subunit alcohol dehydrogenase family)
VSGRLRGQRILLTGGGWGIGRAAALAYAAEGATVTVLERSPEHARELGAAGGRGVEAVIGDAGDPEILAEALARTAGPDGLDNLTCCVGVFDYYAGLRNLSAAQLDAAATEIYRVNVLSALMAVQVALPALQRARGSITLTLSESAFHAAGGGVLYGSAKWALRGVLCHLAADLAPEIRVNAVAPGGTTGTRFGGLSTLGQTQTADRVEGRDERIAAGTLLGVVPRPEDHAGAYVYFADRAAAGATTGAVINTDAGRKF